MIILNHPNNGSFEWTIPASVAPDTNYRVKIVGGTVEFYSDNYFSIMQSSLQVVAPNGGENWVAGTTRSITWTAAGAVGANVRIDLYKGGALESVIAASTPNAGSYSWAIPALQTLGADYTIRVTSIAQPALFDESDAPFTIGSSAGIITAPVGDEVWLGGETRMITWQQGAVASNTVSLYLVKGQSDPSPGAETPIILNTPEQRLVPLGDPLVHPLRHGLPHHAGRWACDGLQRQLLLDPADRLPGRVAQRRRKVAGRIDPQHHLAQRAAAGANVRIELFKKDVLNSVIAASTPNNGSYAWTIRNEQNLGSDYTVRVTSLTNAQVAGESAEPFTVVIGQPYDILLSNDTASIYSPIGTTVGAFTTLDPNPGDTFTYSLDFCAGCDNASFRIAGGTLQTAEVFMTIGATKNITVTSTDQSGLEVTKNFRVFVVGPDQLPSDLSLNDSMIVTGLPVGTRVGEFSTVDPNAADPNYGETFLYTLVAGAGSADNGDFQIVGNQLQTDTIFLSAAP